MPHPSLGFLRPQPLHQTRLPNKFFRRSALSGWQVSYYLLLVALVVFCRVRHCICYLMAHRGPPSRDSSFSSAASPYAVKHHAQPSSSSSHRRWKRLERQRQRALLGKAGSALRQEGSSLIPGDKKRKAPQNASSSSFRGARKTATADDVEQATDQEAVTADAKEEGELAVQEAAVAALPQGMLSSTCSFLSLFSLS
jgi:hypothetical protein